MNPELQIEFPIGDVPLPLYFNVAQRAAEKLKWKRYSVSGNTLIYHTRGINNILGEIITITMSEGIATFHSIAANEYYYHEHQNQLNADRFRHTVVEMLSKIEAAQRIQSPLVREKYGALMPSPTYMVTPILIYLNVLVFLLMCAGGVSPIQPSVDALFAWGGVNRQAVVAGQSWRMITYMFLHAGFLHILFNMFALVYIGQLLEPLQGKFRFAVSYILSGVCAGLLSMLMHPYSVGVGASGAIFGMYGVFLAMLTTNFISRTARNTMMRSILFFVVFNLFMGMQGNVDNAAHIGGLVSGIIIGYVYFPGIRRKEKMQSQIIVSTILLLAIGILSWFTIGYLQKLGLRSFLF